VLTGDCPAGIAGNEVTSLFQSTFPYALLTVLILIGLAVTVVNDPFITGLHRRIMLIIVSLCACLIVQNYYETILCTGPPHILMRTFVSVLGYSLRPVVIVLFLYVVRPDRRYPFAWMLVAANAALHATAFTSHICFWIDEQNRYQGGPLNRLSLLVSLVLMVYYLYLTFQTFGHVRKKESIVPFFNFLLIILATFLDYQQVVDWPIACITIAMAVSSLFSYIWLHLRFAEEHMANLEAEQRLKIMMSQMQPHFLFNTISTIQVLCNTDPQQASMITGKFGKYLRQNLESLENNSLIAFDQELSHALNYAEIEMVRFPNIRIETDIQDSDFTLPSLTVQPMVENAIRHGVRIRENGLIRISTEKADGYHKIIIWDNGKGFDTASIEQKDGLHIGIRNVRERLQRMCGGTMEITSTPGEGTTVLICIPEEAKK